MYDKMECGTKQKTDNYEVEGNARFYDKALKLLFVAVKLLQEFTPSDCFFHPPCDFAVAIHHPPCIADSQ